MKRSEVLETLAAHRDELRARFAVKSLALFGSVARDEATDTSDVDLLVEFGSGVPWTHYLIHASLDIPTGWPRAVSRPGLPQTRTCAINAFGSSSYPFATPRYTEWITRR